MKTETKIGIKKAIAVLTKLITVDIKPDEALKFTQAALNLAHTRQVLKTK